MAAFGPAGGPPPSSAPWHPEAFPAILSLNPGINAKCELAVRSCQYEMPWKRLWNC